MFDLFVRLFIAVCAIVITLALIVAVSDAWRARRERRRLDAIAGSHSSTLALLLGCIFIGCLLPACVTTGAAHAFGVNFGACEAGHAPQEVTGLVNDASQILLAGGPSMDAQLAHVGESAGITLAADTLDCVVAAAIASLAAPAPAGAKLWALDPEAVAAAVARGRAWLAMRGKQVSELYELPVSERYRIAWRWWRGRLVAAREAVRP